LLLDDGVVPFLDDYVVAFPDGGQYGGGALHPRRGVFFLVWLQGEVWQPRRLFELAVRSNTLPLGVFESVEPTLEPPAVIPSDHKRRPKVRWSLPLRSCRTIRRFERVLFSTRIQNALRAADLKTVGEVREISDETLISLPDFGKGSLSDLRKKLGLPSTDGVRPLSKKR
jgi:DNA-directed RNA polymerase alpha subunit